MEYQNQDINQNSLISDFSESDLMRFKEGLNHSDPQILECCLMALGEAKYDGALIEILKCLKHPNFHIRTDAAQALGEIGNKDAIPGLLESLRDTKEGSSVRLSIIEALEKINHEDAVPGLLEFLCNVDSDLSLTPNHSLAWKKALDSIIRIIKDKPELEPELGKIIPQIWEACLTEEGDYLSIIGNIQSHCQFYNYELWQEAESIQKATTKLGDQ